jgi:hypothetical protein
VKNARVSARVSVGLIGLLLPAAGLALSAQFVWLGAISVLRVLKSRPLRRLGCGVSSPGTNFAPDRCSASSGAYVGRSSERGARGDGIDTSVV